jgi:hypothetical protein
MRTSKLIKLINRASAFWLVFFLLMGLLLAIRSLSQSNIGTPILVRPTYLLATALLHIVFINLICVIWARLLKNITGHNTSHRQSFSQISLMAIGKYIPGKIWGIMARGGELQKDGLNIHGYIGAVFLEQYLFLLGCLILVSTSAPWLIFQGTFFTSTAILVPLEIITAFYCQRICFNIFNKITKNKNSKQPQISLLAFALYSISYAFLWAVAGLVFYALLLATTPTSPSWSILIQSVNASAIGVAAGFIAIFSPGGIGVREGAITSLMAPTIGIGYAAQISISYRIFTTISDLTCGGITLLISLKRH